MAAQHLCVDGMAPCRLPRNGLVLTSPVHVDCFSSSATELRRIPVLRQFETLARSAP